MIQFIIKSLLALPVSPYLSLVLVHFHLSLLGSSCFYLSLFNSLTCEIYLSLSLFLPGSPWLSLDFPGSSCLFLSFFNSTRLPLISICFLFFFCSSLALFVSFQFLFSFFNPFFFFCFELRRISAIRQLVLNYETSLVRVMNDPKRKSGGRPLKDGSHMISRVPSSRVCVVVMCTRSNALCACLFVSMLNWWRVVSIVDKRLSIFYMVAWNYHFSRIILPSFYPHLESIFIWSLYSFHFLSCPNYKNSCPIKNLFKKYLW